METNSASNETLSKLKLACVSVQRHTVAPKNANIISSVVAQNSSMHVTATFTPFRGSIEELPGIVTLRDRSIITKSFRWMITVVENIDRS